MKVPRMALAMALAFGLVAASSVVQSGTALTPAPALTSASLSIDPFSVRDQFHPSIGFTTTDLSFQFSGAQPQTNYKMIFTPVALPSHVVTIIGGSDSSGNVYFSEAATYLASHTLWHVGQKLDYKLEKQSDPAVLYSNSALLTYSTQGFPPFPGKLYLSKSRIKRGQIESVHGCDCNLEGPNTSTGLVSIKGRKGLIKKIVVGTRSGMKFNFKVPTDLSYGTHTLVVKTIKSVTRQDFSVVH